MTDLKNPERMQNALGIAIDAARDPALSGRRSRCGDMYIGAVAAGATEKEAVGIAVDFTGTDNPINPAGGLFIGAYRQLERGANRG